jgi:hypothetical protein
MSALQVAGGFVIAAGIVLARVTPRILGGGD